MPVRSEKLRTVPPYFFIMKKPFLSFFAAMSSVPALLLCVALSFTSCSSGDDESDGSQSGQVASKSTWYFYDDNLSSYVSEINSAYNKDASKYYDYVSDNGTCLGYYYAIEIINKNTLKMWNFSYGVVGCKESIDSEYYIPTNYTIGPDKIISYSTSSSMYTYVENEGKMIVTNGDIYTITPQGLIKDGRSDVMKKKEVYKSNFEKEAKIVKNLKSHVNVTSDVSKCEYNVVFTSSLGSTYPAENFVFGTEYGDGRYNHRNDIYRQESNSKNGNIKFEACMFEDTSFRDIYHKLANCEQLTSKERETYTSLHLTIDREINDRLQSFWHRSYVRYGGVKYYFD